MTTTRYLDKMGASQRSFARIMLAIPCAAATLVVIVATGLGCVLSSSKLVVVGGAGAGSMANVVPSDHYSLGVLGQF